MSTTPPSGHVTRITVCCGDAVLPAALRELVAAGWQLRTSLDLERPGEGAEATVLCTGTVGRRRDVESVVTLLVHGTSAAVECSDRGLAVDLYDQGSRLATAEWFDGETPPPTAGLDDLQISLLCAVATGHGVAGAARACHVSARTAARRIAAARDVLSARSTAVAAAAVRERIDALRPAASC